MTTVDSAANQVGAGNGPLIAGLVSDIGQARRGRPRRTGIKSTRERIAEGLGRGEAPTAIVEALGCRPEEVSRVSADLARTAAFAAQSARIEALERDLAALRDLVLRRMGQPDERLDRLYVRARVQEEQSKASLGGCATG
jgi:hypothetical protein